MNHALLAIRDLIQHDVNSRGLASDPASNLITACAEDFANACRSLASARPTPHVVIVTGFFISSATPPAGETDGPLGAVFLARALMPLGFRVSILTDDFCLAAIRAGLDLANCGAGLHRLPTHAEAETQLGLTRLAEVRHALGPVTHLIAIERVGPAHDTNRCHTMRGIDITHLMSPVHRLFDEALAEPTITTIGIGDGGNEIGMGKIPRDVIARNIPRGGQIACRVATDFLIVSGISNWGAYGLAAGVWLMRDARADVALLDIERERAILTTMVEAGPLVDGARGILGTSVDGLDFDRYVEILPQLFQLH